MNSTINLFKDDLGQIKCWDPTSVLYLRTRFRIVGSLVGNLPPQLPQRTGFWSLPLVLMPEEVALLLEMKSARIVDEKSTHASPSLEELKAFENAYQKHLDAYQVAHQARADAIKDAKLKDPNSHPLDDPKLAIEPPVLIHTASTSLPWHHSPDALSEASFTWPQTPEEIVRFKVFKEIWNKGFYISKASYFGGDYLLYPGDPSRFHSNYICTVAMPDQEFSALDAVSMGRLGTSVKKTHAICSWTPEKGLITVCIDWAGSQ